ncbi:MAG: formate dehydrogenase accessory sulfurtransferase FdhD [Acidimicrobiales bacterium]|nr:formate dehydrogenase accessory sulfurtransferase FdhD [Acidimicrobiales bacterium]MDP6285685.1 formate dehydrogenase accessory sulfurtransferase FdhD [Acidimicrobiales bacterium]HJL90978.1 formate dehydrogenase accessory sulfurtransferase FdhD [Acidimicrobiales bacterium]HJO41524.1 formate dehydrogenase accessory sulfurtransferase FdhD [Acidimicrobiales bacterium]
MTARGRTVKVFTEKIESGERQRVPDEVIVEEPISIRLDGELIGTTMRTPGNDFELAAGFCLTEGLLHEAKIKSIRYCGQSSASEAEFNDVTVDTNGLGPKPVSRLGPASSSCGICGVEAIENLVNSLEPLISEAFDIETLTSVADNIQKEQDLFGATGAVHAAMAFDRSGRSIAIREDIGRHNAVDKIVGHLYLGDSLPANEMGLWVSGRASFEMVQKAWAAGFACLIAVSGPSALAVETAKAAGLQLGGFARENRINLYS